jgi:signal transduction histidine kinase
MGVGLSISRAFIERHGGTLQIDGEPGGAQANDDDKEEVDERRREPVPEQDPGDAREEGGG